MWRRRVEFSQLPLPPLSHLDPHEAYLAKEREVISTTRFSPPEVEAFRDIFLGNNRDNPRTLLSFSDLKHMIGDIVPLGAGHVRQLKQSYEEFSTHEVSKPQL